jgi:hypothetical protein
MKLNLAITGIADAITFHSILKKFRNSFVRKLKNLNVGE